MTTVAEYIVELEYDQLRKNAELNNWALAEFDPLSFVIGFTASNNIMYWCKVECEGYKIYPPKWHGYDPVTNMIDNPIKFPIVGGSNAKNYFQHGFICAPWNQLAYKKHGGQHENWNMLGWLSNPDTGPNCTLAFMANQIHQDLRYVVE